MRRLEGQPRIRLHTSFDPQMACGLANVEIEGLEPAAVADHLWKTQRIFITPIVHTEYRGLRITPNVYTRIEEVDVFADAMESVARNGLT
jgi:selenocysteine lyase/cysteine desulfurase